MRNQGLNFWIDGFLGHLSLIRLLVCPQNSPNFFVASQKCLFSIFLWLWHPNSKYNFGILFGLFLETNIKSHETRSPWPYIILSMGKYICNAWLGPSKHIYGGFFVFLYMIQPKNVRRQYHNSLRLQLKPWKWWRMW